MQQLILGISYAIWWMMEPYCLKPPISWPSVMAQWLTARLLKPEIEGSNRAPDRYGRKSFQWTENIVKITINHVVKDMKLLKCNSFYCRINKIGRITEKDIIKAFFKGKCPFSQLIGLKLFKKLFNEQQLTSYPFYISFFNRGRSYVY